jgi:hypothetical protein
MTIERVTEIRDLHPPKRQQTRRRVVRPVPLMPPISYPRVVKRTSVRPRVRKTALQRPHRLRRNKPQNSGQLPPH